MLEINKDIWSAYSCWKTSHSNSNPFFFFFFNQKEDLQQSTTWSFLTEQMSLARSLWYLAH